MLNVTENLISKKLSYEQINFSLMDLTKNKLRCRMSSSTLDRLMRIAFEGPEDFSDSNWELLVDAFKAMNNRFIAL